MWLAGWLADWNLKVNECEKTKKVMPVMISINDDDNDEMMAEKDYRFMRENVVGKY